MFNCRRRFEKCAVRFDHSMQKVCLFILPREEATDNDGPGAERSPVTALRLHLGYSAIKTVLLSPRMVADDLVEVKITLHCKLVGSHFLSNYKLFNGLIKFISNRSSTTQTSLSFLNAFGLHITCSFIMSIWLLFLNPKGTCTKQDLHCVGRPRRLYNLFDWLL